MNFILIYFVVFLQLDLQASNRINVHKLSIIENTSITPNSSITDPTTLKNVSIKPDKYINLFFFMVPINNIKNSTGSKNNNTFINEYNVLTESAL
jgi:hypothetical protein